MATRFKEIRLYIEGAKRGDLRARLRVAFGEFLKPLRSKAPRRGLRWSVVMSGGTHDTLEDFDVAMKSHPHALVLVLVDAEKPMEYTGDRLDAAAKQLISTQKGDFSSEPDEKQIHLMVQLMEAWFFADLAAVKDCFPDLVERHLNVPNNVETVPKQDVLRKLKDTSRGRYSKSVHSHVILAKLDPALVCSRAPFCQRLFSIIEQAIDSQG